MNVSYLNANDFIAAKNRGDSMTIIDLRTAAEVASECLDDCISLPLQELDDQKFKSALDNHAKDKDAPVYLLCQSGRRAEMAIQQLGDCEHVSLVILEGGLNAIKDAGASVNKGKKNVICLERQVRITAGLFVVSGVVLGFLIHPGFFLVSGFVGAGLTFAGITNTCGMAMILARMPWNSK